MTATVEFDCTTNDSVYQPQEDSHLLVDALRRQPVAGADVADLCTGSGVLAAHAVLLGAHRVTAVDSSRAAITSVRELSGRPGFERIEAVHQDVGTFSRPESFDLITCNPPYVPTPADTDTALHPPGPHHSWDAGPRGRAVLDVVCATAPSALRPGGRLLLVQSEFADIPASLAALSRAGLSVRTVAESEIPFGPVLSARATWLEEQGLLPRGRRREVIAVISGERER